MLVRYFCDKIQIMCVEVELRCLLGGREVSGFEDAAVHLADERHGVGDALVPAGVAPRALAGLAPRLQVLVAPNMMHIVQPSDL